LWSVVLAGGEGSRLMGAVIEGRRIDRPKQFCRFGGGESLLQMTLARARRATRPSRLVPVVMEPHRAWWQPELSGVPTENILVQPGNRGTAIALLHSVLHVLRHDDDPLIVVLPCDHGVGEEAPLRAALDRAIAGASDVRHGVVLLGAIPDHPETEYGWILPGPGGATSVRRVRGFVEKPSLPVAADLIRQGALWNTFLLAGSGHALLELFRTSLPRLLGTCIRRMPRTGRGGSPLARLYASLPALDFSRDVLERSTDRLRVARMHACGWTDLGTPARLESWLARRRPVQSLASVRDFQLTAPACG
jgi:mannose-1-phosphate guanylyltransferase